jgi:hypothetical protein
MSKLRDLIALTPGVQAKIEDTREEALTRLYGDRDAEISTVMREIRDSVETLSTSCFTGEEEPPRQIHSDKLAKRLKKKKPLWRV